jgi:hypothetical protein
MTQQGLAGPNLAKIFHDWMKGNPDEGIPKGESSTQELFDVLEGRSPLPSGARMILDVEPQPRGLAREDVQPFPAWHVKLLSESGVTLADDTLTKDEPEGQACRIQAPEREQGVYMRSQGYRIILIGPETSERASLELHCTLGDMISDTLTIPWVARG